METLLSAREIRCSRVSLGNQPVTLDSLSFECFPGSLHLLLGSESSANRLFLRILGLLEKPDSGEVLLRGVPTSHLGPDEMAELRSRRFGYVFPEPFLLPSLGIFENVAMPLFKISEVDIEGARQRTSDALEFVGLNDCEELLAGDLSLLDQHRVSLARALVNRPEILILESLDAVLSEAELNEMILLVRRAAREYGTAALFNAADRRLVSLMDRVMEMEESSTGASGEPGM